MPSSLQKEVHAIVEQTRVRSGWPATRTLVALGVSRRSYYRWLKSESWTKPSPAPNSNRHTVRFHPERSATSPQENLA